MSLLARSKPSPCLIAAGFGLDQAYLIDAWGIDDFLIVPPQAVIWTLQPEDQPGPCLISRKSEVHNPT